MNIDDESECDTSGNIKFYVIIIIHVVFIMSPTILYETHMKVIDQEPKISRNSSSLWFAFALNFTIFFRHCNTFQHSLLCAAMARLPANFECRIYRVPDPSTCSRLIRNTNISNSLFESAIFLLFFFVMRKEESKRRK